MIIAAVVVLLTASLAAAQEIKRFVLKNDHYENAPIEIVGLNVGEKHFTDNFSIMGATGWW